MPGQPAAVDDDRPGAGSDRCGQAEAALADEVLDVPLEEPLVDDPLVDDPEVDPEDDSEDEPLDDDPSEDELDEPEDAPFDLPRESVR